MSESLKNKISEMVSLGIIKQESGPTVETRLLSIANGILGLETLDDMGSDSIDFQEQAVWNIRHALVLAFITGLTYKNKGDNR